jgi:hypothetical protein
MPVSPRDIININSPFYVHAVKSEKTLNGESLSVSGIFPDGEYYEDYPMREDELVVLQEEAPEYDVRMWFDREYRLRQLDRAIFASSEDEAAAYYHYRQRSDIPRHHLSLSLTDRNPANTLSSLLLDAKDALTQARGWVLEKRHECLDAFAERYADYQAEAPDKPLSVVLGMVYAEMFSFEKGKPLCLPSPAEEYNIYGKTYEECAARLMEVTLEMTFDIDKSINYVQWAHSELNTFYDELGREFDPACWEVVDKLSI